MRFAFTHPSLHPVAIARDRADTLVLAPLVPLVAGTAIAWRETHVLDVRIAAAAILAIVLATFVSIFYTRLADRGLGELIAFAIYGPGIVLGTILLLGGSVDTAAFEASVILGILAALVLIVDELPEERALVGRVGRDVAASLVGLFFAIAFLLALAIVAWREEVYFAGALIGVPISYFAYRSLCREFIGRPVVAQKATLITYVVTGAGLALGAMLLP